MVRPNFPLFRRLKCFFSYFRILVIWEIDFRDFGNSGNQILDIGFRILKFRILIFGILTFGITNSEFWTVILIKLQKGDDFMI